MIDIVLTMANTFWQNPISLKHCFGGQSCESEIIETKKAPTVSVQAVSVPWHYIRYKYLL